MDDDLFKEIFTLPQDDQVLTDVIDPQPELLKDDIEETVETVKSEAGRPIVVINIKSVLIGKMFIDFTLHFRADNVDFDEEENKEIFRKIFPNINNDSPVLTRLENIMEVMAAAKDTDEDDDHLDFDADTITITMEADSSPMWRWRPRRYRTRYRHYSPQYLYGK